MSEKINAVKLNSANVKYDNSVDTERVYDIEANTNLNGSKVVSMDGGAVRKETILVASFSMYGDHHLNINFQNVSDTTEMCSILNAINEFIKNIELDVTINNITI